MISLMGWIAFEIGYNFWLCPSPSACSLPRMKPREVDPTKPLYLVQMRSDWKEGDVWYGRRKDDTSSHNKWWVCDEPGKSTNGNGWPFFCGNFDPNVIEALNELLEYIDEKAVVVDESGDPKDNLSLYAYRIGIIKGLADNLRGAING